MPALEESSSPELPAAEPVQASAITADENIVTNMLGRLTIDERPSQEESATSSQYDS